MRAVEVIVVKVEQEKGGAADLHIRPAFDLFARVNP